MKKSIWALGIVAGALSAPAQFLADFAPHDKAEHAARLGAGEVKITGQYVSASRQTGELTASGGVSAVSGAFRFMGEHIRRDKNGLIDFGRDVAMTTCTNAPDKLHWKISTTAPADWLPDGTLTFQDSVYTNAAGDKVHRSLTLRNMWAYWHDMPVLWIPFWYYPFDTNYGWRFLPGYSSRWGGYFLSGYVYNIVNEGVPGTYGLGGSTYFDYRTENGVALGQTVRWHLKDFGYGKFKVWHAWDEDHDRYDRRWSDSRHNYRNWGSDVSRERYRLLLQHQADFTERDAFRLQAQHLSDSHVLRDFFRDIRDRQTYPENEMWYEHRENDWALGVLASGPIERFYGGVQRVPESWFAVMPQPVWTLPVNYESQTRAGYLNRDAARYDGAETAFSHLPYIGHDGSGADYQAFRADTAHRFTLPMKFWDVLSVVPRASYRCTWWSDSGDGATAYTTASDDALARHIFEAGATVSARGSAWLDDQWRHTFEPYVDYSLQEANLSQSGKNRYYTFDAYDRATDWLDQFGFEGRGLPYSWHGIRPGVRNFFQRRDEKGVLRTVLDTDLYLAVPFEDESRYAWDYKGDDRIKQSLRGRAHDDEHGPYSQTSCVVPGFRARYAPTRDTRLSTRVEYDCEEERFAYADVIFSHHVSNGFSWNFGYLGRDHRIWDYLATPAYELGNGNSERWNYEITGVMHVDFQHHVCDWFAWSPWVRFETRRSEVEEVGVWFDLLSDCLGYRFEFAYEDGYRRIDGSKNESDVRVMFFIYLRALGPGSMLDLAKF